MNVKENCVLRIGLLGCGPIAQFAHLPALANGAHYEACQSSRQVARTARNKAISGRAGLV